MIKLPYPSNEKARLAVLESYHLMDSGWDKDFDAIASIASVICGIPISLITFIDEGRQYFKSHIGTDATENLRELSFCTHAIASGEEVLIIEDATRDERFADNPLVTGPTKLVFYAGVPLVNEDGFALGTLCVLDQKKHELSPGQVSALKSLAKQIVDKIELKRKIATLETTNHELLNANVLIQKFASMAAHDIKNPLTSILLTSQLLRVSTEKAGNERSLKLLDVNISSTKTLLTLVDEMLDYSKSPGLLIARKQKFTTRGLFERLKGLVSPPENFTINFHSQITEIYHSVIAMEQILLNLLTNAIRYNDKVNGEVMVTINEEKDVYVLEVADNGIGIPQEFHHQIFSSNFTLDQTDRFEKKGTGIGLSTVKDLVNALNGDVALKSTVGEGSVFTVRFGK
ncbi:GAF domain-containing sensor histidine kinase [Pedobacter sp. L105]|uniref:GAF domain-containing sensor histidine kinase n=1 Tax=Pedobacter sp. L105 TaxID=1641871 RepID=UPI00131E1603|nr:GAF domain-containing sensor histidine kinase [Pedobacter sp. L105]